MSDSPEKKEIKWSGEIITEITPNRNRSHDQLFPDLPDGMWKIKATGIAIPYVKNDITQ